MASSENEDDYSPSEQLHSSLRSSITTALNTSRRPLLTHLNADTTWLLSIPYPLTAANSRSRRYYHILIDPWLKGGQADVAKFFSQQWHEVESCVQSIREVEDVIRGIETAAQGGPYQDEDWEVEEEQGKWIDAVVISHEFTDHMHRETLLEVSPSVPIFGTSKAATIMRSWKHFDAVLDIPRFLGDWRDSSTSPLPDWVSLSRVAYDGPDLLYYHSAIMITFPARTAYSEEGGEAEAIIYTPHGISPENLSSLVTATPPIRTLALLHGLQNIQIKTSWTTGVKAQLNKGAHNGLKVQRMLKARYWIGTHDEVKRGGGVVSWFLDRTAISLQDAMELEKKDLEIAEGVPVELGDVRFEELRNGESLILE